MTSLANTTAFTALTYNARLWGNTGLVYGEPTRLYLDDHRRVDRIADRLIETGADLVGLQEVFCPEMQSRLAKRLWSQYPYQAWSGTYDGVEQSIRTVRRLWPRFGDLYARHIQKVVDFFTLSHYERAGRMTRLAKNFVSEDAALRFLFEATERQFLWGAGLMLFSKHPILDWEFQKHPARADLEWFADKGLLKAEIEWPCSGSLTVLLTHIQEGETRHAASARGRQIGRVRDLLNAPGPAVVLGDMNVSEGRHGAYAEMVAYLMEAGALDCFRSLHPDAQAAPGHTYRIGGKFERKLLGESHTFFGDDQRLDYIFARGLRVLWSGVLEDEFSGLSDHSPVAVRFGAG